MVDYGWKYCRSCAGYHPKPAICKHCGASVIRAGLVCAHCRTSKKREADPRRRQRWHIRWADDPGFRDRVNANVREQRRQRNAAILAAKQLGLLSDDMPTPGRIHNVGAKERAKEAIEVHGGVYGPTQIARMADVSVKTVQRAWLELRTGQHCRRKRKIPKRYPVDVRTNLEAGLRYVSMTEPTNYGTLSASFWTTKEDAKALKAERAASIAPHPFRENEQKLRAGYTALRNLGLINKEDHHAEPTP
jgi:hypothetical protein